MGYSTENPMQKKSSTRDKLLGGGGGGDVVPTNYLRSQEIPHLRIPSTVSHSQHDSNNVRLLASLGRNWGDAQIIGLAVKMYLHYSPITGGGAVTFSVIQRAVIDNTICMCCSHLMKTIPQDQSTARHAVTGHFYLIEDRNYYPGRDMIVKRWWKSYGDCVGTVIATNLLLSFIRTGQVAWREIYGWKTLFGNSETLQEFWSWWYPQLYIIDWADGRPDL